MGTRRKFKRVRSREMKTKKKEAFNFCARETRKKGTGAPDSRPSQTRAESRKNRVDNRNFRRLRSVQGGHG